MTTKEDDSGIRRRSNCPLACTLDILGDKWTLLVIRDLFFGKHTFKQLQDSMEHIPSNLLADRLKRLEHTGILEKRLYQNRPKRYSYHLTQMGRDLERPVRALGAWANRHIAGTETIPGD